MFPCPRCLKILTRTKTEFGLLWSCLDCGGRAINVGMLRPRIEREFMNNLWLSVRDEAEAGKMSIYRCPSCNLPMHAAIVEGVAGRMEVDGCDTCQFLWFDKGEAGAMPLLPPKALRAKVPRLDGIQAVRLGELMREGKDVSSTPPESGWEHAMTVLGFPVEEDSSFVERIPWVTWITALLIVLCGVAAFAAGMEASIAEYALHPAEAFRHYGTTFVTAFLLHGGLIHLGVCTYFLLLVGDNVEEFAGGLTVVWHLVLGTLVASALYLLLAEQDAEPLFGAGGGVTALIVYYALQFPRIRLCFALHLGFFFRWFRMTVGVAVLLWMGFLFVGAWKEWPGFSILAAKAHLSGGLVGLAFWCAGQYADVQRT